MRNHVALDHHDVGLGNGRYQCGIGERRIPDRLLTVPAAARIANVSKSKAYALARAQEGVFSAVVRVGSSYRISLYALCQSLHLDPNSLDPSVLGD